MNVFELLLWTAALWGATSLTIWIVDATQLPLPLMSLAVVVGFVAVMTLVGRIAK